MSTTVEDPRKERARELVKAFGPTMTAQRLGVSKNTVIRWTNPEYNERMLRQSREAKRRRKGVCKTCGGVTHYGGGKGKPVSEECNSCARNRQHEERIWWHLATSHRFCGVKHV